MGHPDSLYGACLVASADLPALLDPFLRRPERSVAMGELAAALRKASVDLTAVDLDDDVLQALDPRGQGRVFAPDLVAGYAAFRKRHSALLGDLASHLSRRGLAPDELFARATAAPSTAW